MQINHLLTKPNISEAAVGVLREMIIDGKLAAGERINEVHLAAQLGISRTPLREALARLESEGAIVSQPRIGFRVNPLSISEFEQIYPIRAILDPEALRLAGIPSADKLKKLDMLNRRIAQADGAIELIELDDRWHLDLISDCPNRVLTQLIESFIWRTRRYEIAYMREAMHIEIATNSHVKILKELRAGNLDRAARTLRENLQSGIEPIIDWLKQREISSPRRKA